jgi:hypothetical protein
MTRTPVLLASGLAASLILAFAPAAHADTIPISLGARIGYGIPSGESTKNAPMKDGIGGVIPVQLDAMYSLGFGLRLGLYGSYGLLTGLKNNVDSGSQTRLGLQAHFTLPVPLVKPWVGAGIGYEWLSLTSKAGGVEATSSLRGLEVFNLQAGLQLSLLPVLSLGPYVQYQRGTYSQAKLDTPLFKSDGEIKDTAAHGWFHGGLRAELSF